MDISIIIVNYNTRDLLKQCLESAVATMRGISYETIVIDNASADGSADMTAVAFPDVRLIGNRENRGFGAAVNQGIDVMQGRYALLLNTDAVLTEGAVEELLSFMEGRPQAAMACGQLRNADGSKQNSIGNFPTLLTLLTNAPLLEYLFPSKYPSKRYDYERPIEIDSGIGACLMVRKEAIDRVGKLDERYFFFFEETDWARSMKQAGRQVFFVPSANIYHLQGRSIGHNVKSRYLFYYARYQYFAKWSSRPMYVLAVSSVCIRLLANWLLTSLAVLATLGLSRSLRGKWSVYSRLALWHLKGCPPLARK